MLNGILVVFSEGFTKLDILFEELSKFVSFYN
jgi:hypothetical protein